MSDLISRKDLMSIFEEQKNKTEKLHDLFFLDMVLAIIENQAPISFEEARKEISKLPDFPGMDLYTPRKGDSI